MIVYLSKCSTMCRHDESFLVISVFWWYMDEIHMLRRLLSWSEREKGDKRGVNIIKFLCTLHNVIKCISECLNWIFSHSWLKKSLNSSVCPIIIAIKIFIIRQIEYTYEELDNRTLRKIFSTIKKISNWNLFFIQIPLKKYFTKNFIRFELAQIISKNLKLTKIYKNDNHQEYWKWLYVKCETCETKWILSSKYV